MLAPLIIQNGIQTELSYLLTLLMIRLLATKWNIWEFQDQIKIVSSKANAMKRAKSNRDAASHAKKKLKEALEESHSDSSADVEESKEVTAPGSSTNSGNLIDILTKRRLETASSATEFNFKKKRVRLLTDINDVRESCKGGVLYWMSRDARVQDNWAFVFAQKLALKLELPLIVAYSLVPKFLHATMRHYKFLLGGLEEVEQDCRTLNIPFRLLLGQAGERIPEFVRQNDIGAVICDFSPLRLPLQWVEEVKKNLPKDVPLTQVDAHNVVPVWITSDKQEYAARTIRNKVNTKLPEYLTEFPPIIKHPHEASKELYKEVDWKAAYASLECDKSVDEVTWAKPGYRAACLQLESFCQKRLRIFNEKRNDPTVNALSGLSPWFHFGQISVQRCILEVRRFKGKMKDSVEAFCEEAIVRRELSDNFCFYNKQYDNIKGLASWAQQTLREHCKDKRTHVYTLKELENSKTHDDLWNAAQMQLVQEGKMHGFLRMYWAKKILEWTQTPEQALEFAILLNDKYSLDGRDPNGYVGCMWSIGGLHDQGWTERPVFGKIRYMNYKGCERKFKVSAFVARYAKNQKKLQ